MIGITVSGLLVTILIVSVNAMQGGLIMAQTPPSRTEAADYTGLHAAAYTGNLDDLRALIVANADLEARDGWGRTALHVAAHRSHEAAVAILAEAGANMNALDRQAYDIVTIVTCTPASHFRTSCGAGPARRSIVNFSPPDTISINVFPRISGSLKSRSSLGGFLGHPFGSGH